MQPSMRLRWAVAAACLGAELDGEAQAAVEQALRAGAGSILGMIFYGSCRTLHSRDPWSAFDFFVLVRDYASFYRALREGRAVSRPPWLLAALNGVLPPSMVRLAGKREGSRPSKCAVLRWDEFLSATGPRRADHFCAGRLFQPAAVVHAADGATCEALVDSLARAHAATYDWVRPWLPPRFDVAAYCRTLLRVSFAWEIRPEPAGRAEVLFAAQRAALEPVYALLLADLVDAGELTASGGEFAVAREPGRLERLRTRAYFSRSLARSTSRWLKHVITHEGWLEHIVHKAERHGGRPIELTPRERRWPLVFLWPRVFRYLRDKNAGR